MRVSLLTIASVIALALAVLAGWAAIPPITVATLGRHFSVFRPPFGRSLVALLFFGPAFLAASLVTLWLALMVGTRSRIAGALASVTLAIVSFPVMQFVAIVLVHALIGPVVINPSVHLFIAAIAGLLFGVASAALVTLSANTPVAAA